MLAEFGRTHADVRGAGVGVPGPVEFATGTPVAPPIMPGWDGYRVGGRLAEYFGAPTLVDNDVNIMALGEHYKAWRAYDHLLFVKVGTGIGCGIITEGRIHRGAQGAAGDIGHIHVPGNLEICRCGNSGCLEAVAGGGAMAARLRAEGIAAENSRDVVRHVREGRAEAMQLVRQAGRELGEVLAASRQLLQPGRDRHRRRHRPCRRASARGRARGRLPARRPARHPLPADRALRARRPRGRDRRRGHGDRARARARGRGPHARRPAPGVLSSRALAPVGPVHA